MSGHRDDGTSAENKAHHPNRKVSRSDMLFSQLQGMVEGTVAPRNSLSKMWSELPEDEK